MSENRFHKIRSLEVGGGFLDGLKLELDEHLNCVIGGRGTGKTTVLEFLRYGLGAMPDEQRAKAHHRALERLVAGNLGTGQVRVGIETKDGLRYTVERTTGGEPEVFDEQGRATGLSLQHGSIFDLDVYSQNEIERIATSPSFQLDLIDKFVDAEVRELAQRLRTVTRELAANASDLVQLAAQSDELQEGLSELDVVTEKLKAYTPDAGDSGLVDAEVALKGLRDREDRSLSAVRRSIETRRAFLSSASQSPWPEGLIPAEVLEGPNKDPFAAIQAALQAADEEQALLLGQLNAALERCAAAVEAAAAELGDLHTEQDQRYRDLLAKHEQDKGKARERLQLQRRQGELQERQRELTEKQAAIQACKARRRELLRELSDLRDQRTDLRRGVVARLNEKLSPQIRVGLTQAGDSEAYRDMLNAAFKGTGKRYGSLTTAIAAGIPPQDFVRMVLTGGVQDLVEHLDISTERATWVVELLKDMPDIYAIETVEMQDVPTVALRDGDDYKESPDLSTGQKCTTILPILLLESEKPLLIDQPEDNLDNAFIYEAVVSRIQQVKQHRQLIFVTHNPNIPVLGDAGRVFVMTSTGRNASVLASGTVDDVKEHVETILEGGREAFEARKRRYGR